MHRLGGDPQVSGQRRQAQVRDLVAHQPPGQRRGVDPTVREPRVAPGGERGVEERHVETHVVAADHRRGARPEELEQRREHLVDPRGRQHHRLGDPGQHRDERRHRHARVHERVQLAEALAAPVLHRPDLGDRARRGRAARRLEVDDHERDRVQRGAEVVEAALDRDAARRRGRGAGRPRPPTIANIRSSPSLPGVPHRGTEADGPARPRHRVPGGPDLASGPAGLGPTPILEARALAVRRR